MIIAAGLLRRPFGIGLGSALQVLFVLTGILLPAMFVVGLIFAAIWGYLLSLRHELVGTPGGWRLLIS
jgi:putative flippase GtrA